MSRPIEDWLDQVYKTSEFRAQITLEEELDDSFGWGTRLRYLISQPRPERPSGLLLVGPAGSGKRCAASHVIQGMKGKKAGVLFLTGSELSDGCENFQDVKARLNAILDRFYDEQAELLLILEDPGDSPWAQQIYGFLGITALEYARDDSLPALFLVLITREEPKLPSLLRSRLQRCRLNMPDREQRMRYLLKRGRGLRNTLSLDELADATAGNSFGELNDLVRNLELIADVEERIPGSDEIRGFIDGQAVVTEGDGERVRLLRSLEKLLEELPDRMGSFQGSGTVSRVEKKEEEKPAPAPTPVVDADKIANMPVKQLASEVFGEDRTRNMLLN